MTEPQPPQGFQPYNRFDIDARDQARVNAVGELNADTVNFGDRYESQRSVLVVEIDPIPPNRNPDDWIDRHDIQTALTQQMQADSSPLVEIVAAGGFGKSLMAVWAYDQAASGFEARLWINFRKVPSFNAFGRWVHQEIGFEIHPSIAETISDEDLRRQTIYRLTQRRCFVVMDQLEALADAADRSAFEAFLRQWQEQGRKSTIVVTTRQRFLDGDTGYFPLGGFSSEEGVAFLTHPKRGIQSPQPDLLPQLSALAQGHPLLLNLAASWLRQTAKGQLVASGLGFFQGLFASNVENPEAKVGDVFRVVLDQLEPTVQTALLEVSVYQDAFDLERMQAMQPTVTAAAIELLETRGFLLKQQERWTLHPLVRQLVEAAIAERNLGTAAHGKAIAFFEARLQAEQPDTQDYLACFHHHCELGHYEAAYDLINRVYHWLDLRGWYQVLVDIYTRLVTAWTECPPELAETRSKLGWSVTLLGSAYRSLGEYRQAITLREQALTIMKEIGNRNGEATWLGNLGNAYGSLGEYRRAIDFYEQALTITQDIGDRNGEAANLGSLGSAYLSLGEYRRAIDFYGQALTIKQDIGDLNGEATWLGNLGNAYLSLGEYRRAIDFYGQSLTIKQGIGDRNGEATWLGNLGTAYGSLGEYRRAIDFSEQALTIKQDIGDRNGEAANLGSLGTAYSRLGEYRRAIDFYGQALTIMQDIGDRNGTAINLFNRGIAHAKLDDHWAAQADLAAAKDLFEELDLPHMVEKCKQEIRTRNQIIAPVIRQAPKFGEEAEESQNHPATQRPVAQPQRRSGQSRSQWEVYAILALVVVLIILIVQGK